MWKIVEHLVFCLRLNIYDHSDNVMNQPRLYIDASSGMVRSVWSRNLVEYFGHLIANNLKVF